MGAVLALAAAVGFGVSDFVAGLASRRAHFLHVAVVGGTVAAVAVVASLPWTGGGRPATPAVLWGVLGGLAGAAGTLALYRGYGRGEMAVVGPLSAVGAAALPALTGAALGERLAPLALAGVVLALPAIWLVARPAGADHPGRPAGVRTGVVDGLLAGAGFALLFVGLDRAGDGSGLWPVAAGQVTALALFLLWLLLRRRPSSAAPGSASTAGPGPAHLAGHGRSSRGSTLALAAAGGALGVAATILYFFATHTGLLTIAAVLTSVYPAVTVVLAAVLLRERPDRLQLLGLLLGAVAVVAIVAG